MKIAYSVHSLSLNDAALSSAPIFTVSSDKLKTVQIGDGKEIAGIDQGLIGMKKNGRRFLCFSAAASLNADGVGLGGASGVSSPLFVDVSSSLCCESCPNDKHTLPVIILIGHCFQG